MTAPHQTGGDDLDDGLELDPSLLASDSEDGFDENEDDAFLSDEEPMEETVPKGVKRKADDDEEDGEGDGVSAEDAAAAKRKKRREKDKARRAAKALRASNVVTPTSEPTLMAREEIAGLLLASARAAFPASTAMEIDDIAIPAERILQPLDTLPDTTDAFAPLVTRLNDILKDAPKKPHAGTPRALILSLSGIRCADVVRAVRNVKRPGGEVAKLFAKHFKVADQVKYLQKTRVAVAVGTPGRVAKLLENGALKISHQTVVLFDVGHRDSKNRTLLDLPEVRDEMWRNLLSGDARAALKPARFTAF